MSCKISFRLHNNTSRLFYYFSCLFYSLFDSLFYIVCDLSGISSSTRYQHVALAREQDQIFDQGKNSNSISIDFNFDYCYYWRFYFEVRRLCFSLRNIKTENYVKNIPKKILEDLRKTPNWVLELTGETSYKLSHVG